MNELEKRLREEVEKLTQSKRNILFYHAILEEDTILIDFSILVGADIVCDEYFSKLLFVIGYYKNRPDYIKMLIEKGFSIEKARNDEFVDERARKHGYLNASQMIDSLKYE